MHFYPCNCDSCLFKDTPVNKSLATFSLNGCHQKKLICFTLAPTPELSSEKSSALGEKNSPGDTSGP